MNKEKWIITLLILTLTAVLVSSTFNPSTDANPATISIGESITLPIGKTHSITRGATGRDATDYLIVFSGRHPGTDHDTYIFNIIESGLYEGFAYEIYVTQGQHFYIADQRFTLDTVSTEQATITRIP